MKKQALASMGRRVVSRVNKAVVFCYQLSAFIYFTMSIINVFN